MNVMFLDRGVLLEGRDVDNITIPQFAVDHQTRRQRRRNHLRCLGAILCARVPTKDTRRILMNFIR